MNELIRPGSVWLVGAGPGDPDLLTRKAEKLIRAASTVFYDALVGPGVLDLIPAGVKRVAVGKRSGRHSKDQPSINRMLVDAAEAGERVVRLKGGDPSIFGRATEEMQALVERDINVQICPGITAASAAAASVCSSLTLRGMARKLTFVTAHAKAGDQLDLDWQSLADPGATIAVYMGKSSAAIVSRNLIAAGMAKDTPVTMVENASLAGERVFHSRIDLLPLAAKTALGDGPAILLIGKAMQRGKLDQCVNPARLEALQ
ncbi:uroporphyrinogen-III C-methyltransferase [Parasphingorhabdus sp.]|uniref:uroporphyrinogen-III C-methyltransferase n=1 Tax=Parasphingorhabdus sp. TaxID=2709688 RepID=UPI003A8F28CF